MYFIVAYTDNEGDLLPINNDDNLSVALTTARPVLRLLLERKGIMFCILYSAHLNLYEVSVKVICRFGIVRTCHGHR